MLAKALSIAALAAAASAQQMNLTATLASLPQLSNLTSYISGFPALVQQLSSAQNVTLLAPNNAAFTKALNGSSFNVSDTASIEGLFLYHVLNGTYYASSITGNASFLPTALTSLSGNQTLLNPAVVEAVTIGGKATIFSGLLTESTVTSPNHNFTGGTIHIIDTVLTLPQNIGVTAIALNETAAAGALQKANIANGPLPKNITAFIPNNAAFQAISNLVSNLTTTDLLGILGYHLVPNVTAYSTDLMNTTLPTLDPGMNLTITVVGSDIFVNQAKVITPDVLVQEGVVHIIDAVLNPANATAKPAASATAGKPAFAGATSGTAAPFTSGIPPPSSVPMAATGGVAGQASSASSSAAAAASSSSSGVAAMPMVTGAVGAAALFGGAAAILNL